MNRGSGRVGVLVVVHGLEVPVISIEELLELLVREPFKLLDLFGDADVAVLDGAANDTRVLARAADTVPVRTLLMGYRRLHQ